MTQPSLGSLLLVLVIPAVSGSADALAQSSANGSIRGYVRDEQGAILPGATVTVTSAVAGGTRSTVTNSEGLYRLLELPPAEYTLNAELQGFSRFARSGLVVRAGLTIGVDVTLKVGALSETVQVTADTPMLETAATSQAVNISGEFQRALPTSSRRQWIDFLLLTPGTVETQTAQRSSFFVHGSDFGSHVIQFDGADIAAPVQSSNLYVFMSAEAVDDVQVKTAGAPASSPLGQGAVMNVAMQSGTNTLKGSASFVLQGKQWSSNNNPGGTTSAYSLMQPDATLGGPIRRDRAWAFGSYRMSKVDQSVSRTPAQIATLKLLIPGFEPPDNEFDGDYLFLKGTGRINDRHQVQGFYHYGMDRRRSVGPVYERAFATTYVGGDAVSASLASTWSSSLTTRLGVSYNNQSNPDDMKDLDAVSHVTHQRAFITSGRLTGTGAIAQTDNLPSRQIAPASKFTITADATYYKTGWGGSHEVQSGIYVQPLRTVEFGLHYVNGGFATEELVLLDPNNPAGGSIPFHRQIFDVQTVTSTDVNSSDYAFYLQDAWRPTSRLTVNAGVRVDFISRRDRIFDVVMQKTTAIGPRFGVNYVLTSDGRNAVYGSWGRVHEAMSTGSSTTAGTNRAGFRDLYDNDLNGTFETEFITPVTSSVTLNREIDLEGYRQPHLDEWILGYRRQLSGQVTLEASMLRREYRNRIANIEINGIYDGSVFRGYQNEEFNEIFRLTSNVYNWPVYTSIQVQAAKRSSRLQVLASYVREWRHLAGTWQPNDPGLFIQPEAFDNDRGIGSVRAITTNSLSGTDSTNYQPWQDQIVRIAAALQLPWQFTFATNYNLQSGMWGGPVIDRIAAPDPAFGPPTVRLSNGRVVSNPLATTLRFAYPTRGEGQLRTKAAHIWSLRIGRLFDIPGGRLNAAVDVLNILNNDADQSFQSGGNQIFSPTYGIGGSRVVPRTAQVSVMFTF